MVDGRAGRDGEARLGSRHEDFLELCALCASGNLDEAEAKKLREHLAVCPECRETMKEFAAVADHVILEFTPELEEEPSPDRAFSQEKAEASFQKRLQEEQERDGVAGEWRSSASRSRYSLRKHFHRYEIWLPLVASAMLCATFGILSYRTGKNHGIAWARSDQRSQAVIQAALPEAPPTVQAASDPGLAARDAALGDLRREIVQKSIEIEKLKALVASQQVALRTGTEQKSGVTEERDRLLQQVSADEATLRATEARLQTLERERSDYVTRTASLEKSVTDLSRSLQEREQEASKQEDLLAKDRDIRDLIGARELYITEIYDVSHNGDTRKAAGRVFFTKGKSLVFYAYDLNENPGVRDASTFEAWGQRGSDWHQASKLGIFYQDNATKKSWVVKSNDRKALAQIDAVFVTVEPNGGSERPTGKPLLFAYLKVAPNHP